MDWRALEEEEERAERTPVEGERTDCRANKSDGQKRGSPTAAEHNMHGIDRLLNTIYGKRGTNKTRLSAICNSALTTSIDINRQGDKTSKLLTMIDVWLLGGM